MLALGSSTRLMGMGSCITQIKMCMRESGRMTKQMEKESISMQTEPSIMESGLMISSMEQGLSNGLMEQFMKVSITTERSMVRES